MLPVSGGRNLDRSVARGFAPGDADEATLERIRNAIRACTEESLESVDHLSAALETANKIFARRSSEPAAAPVHVTTET